MANDQSLTTQASRQNEIRFLRPVPRMIAPPTTLLIKPRQQWWKIYGIRLRRSLTKKPLLHRFVSAEPLLEKKWTEWQRRSHRNNANPVCKAKARGFPRAFTLACVKRIRGSNRHLAQVFACGSGRPAPSLFGVHFASCSVVPGFNGCACRHDRKGRTLALVRFREVDGQRKIVAASVAGLGRKPEKFAGVVARADRGSKLQTKGMPL
ncbi:hypothetical protein ACFSC1_18925 [Paracoccus aurantiacus]|uniref:hypothetical protein n=1 Tax=Paracoccus aurantiacus TaxID=2599412 RepID=UPI003627C108